MSYYPLFLNLKGRGVLIVGAGTVATQKVQGFLTSEAVLHVVAPTATPELEQLMTSRSIRWSRRPYAREDVKGMSLVIAATNHAELQHQIAADARAQSIWVNVVDDGDQGDFRVPSVIARGDLQVAISTDGAAPALAKFIRLKLDPLIGPEYGMLVDLLRPLRDDISRVPLNARPALWAKIVNTAFLDQIKTEGPERAGQELKRWIADAF